jgi:hypothetical protein
MCVLLLVDANHRIRRISWDDLVNGELLKDDNVRRDAPWDHEAC